VPSKSVLIAQGVNEKLERLMPVLFPLATVLGFTVPAVFAPLRPLVPVLFAVMTLSGSLRLKVSEFGNTVKSPAPILIFFATFRLLMPLLVMFMASVFFAGSRDTVTGFILLFAGPVGVASFVWVGMFKGDRALALTLILLDTMLAPIAIPGTLSLLMGQSVEMDMGSIALSLVWMVVLPTVVGVTVNETSKGKIPDAVCPYLAPLGKIFLMMVIAANSSALAGEVNFKDPLVWKVAALGISLASGGFLLARLAGIAARCPGEKKVAMFFCGGLKNISASATIAVTFFPEAVALPVITGILFQQILAAVMSNLIKPVMRDKHAS